MPATLTYPGLYVEEVPSGVHPIVGAATADTAFVDYFPRGPVNTPTRVTSLTDFERIFGGVDQASEASYAIVQYYLNGGQNAWVVRIDHGSPKAAQAILDTSSGVHSLVVSARNPGLWGKNLRVAVTATVPAQDGRFNLFVQETRVDVGVTTVVATESHLGLTMDRTDPSYVVAAVNAASALVSVAEHGDSTHSAPKLDQPTATGDAPDTAYQYLVLGNGDEGSALGTDGRLSTTGLGDALKAGWTTLDRIDPFIFNLLCVPAIALLPTTEEQKTAIGAAQTYCHTKRAFLIVDPPSKSDVNEFLTWLTEVGRIASTNAAVYFPRLKVADPRNGGRLRDIGASGTVAGIYARTDTARGVWKAPAGIDATLVAATPSVSLNDADSAVLNPQGINALRTFAVFGPVIWGARTLFGADQRASEWKYVPVRRTALFIEDSLVAGLHWVVFEPNDEPLWAQIRLNVGAFMQDLFLRGAFKGTTPREAYLVKCDRTTTTQADIDKGVVNILVGFAPLKPAEFVVIRIQQLAGQAQA
jgi:phage tail sheath protein FI